MALVEVRDLEKTYYNDGIATPAVRGMSFDIHKGEFVAIMGPSGSGKSTLLHILGFLDEPTKGTYKFDGKSIKDFSQDGLAKARNEKMGFVFQMFNLLPRTTVFDNVMLPLVYSEVPAEKRDAFVKGAIKGVGLDHRMAHESSQLSGGERQRVAIARALVNNPDIIFADEPTGNLDSKSGGQVMSYIEELHKQGNTIVLITHETYTAEFAERIIHLKDGVIESDVKVKNRRNSNGEFHK